MRVDPAGEWIELTDTGPDEVIVLGYTREPYLRLADPGDPPGPPDDLAVVAAVSAC